MQVTHERVKVPVGSGSMPAYLARPTAPGTFPAVLVFMEVFGVNHHIRSVADRVAAEGHVALAPDVFHRTAPGVELKYDAAGVERGIALMSQVQASEAMADVGGALAYLKSRREVGGRGVGTIGFCFGGHLAYLAACEHPIAATASFYGGGIAGPAAPGGEMPATIARTPKIAGRMLCLFGERDGYIPVAQAAAIEEALATANVRHEVVIYPGVGHGFFCDERADYDATSAEDAWHRVTRLFRSELH
jgi:carboxymethylenebutenolidase